MNGNRINSVLLVVCICGVCFGQTADMEIQRAQKLESDFRELAVKMAWDDEMVRRINGLSDSDKELTKKFDLPSEVLDSTSTDKLFKHVIISSMVAMLSLYEQPEVGLQRLINASGTMVECYLREDLMDGVLKMYSEYDFSPAKISDKNIREKYEFVSDLPDSKGLFESENIGNIKITSICMPIYRCDQIMMCEQFFCKTKGYEKKFLRMFADRYDKIAELKKVYDNDTDPFGSATAWIWPMSVRLADSIDKEFSEKLKSIQYKDLGWEDRFIVAIKEYLEQPVKNL